MLPIDAKYKRYDLKRVGIGDLQQSFLYAHAYAGGGSSGVPMCLLVHPTAEPEERVQSLQIRDLSGCVRARTDVIGVPIPELLTEARSGKHGKIAGVFLRAVRRHLQLQASQGNAA